MADSTLGGAVGRIRAVLDAAYHEHGPPDPTSIWADVATVLNYYAVTGSQPPSQVTEGDKLREALERARPHVVNASAGVVVPLEMDEALADLQMIDAALSNKVSKPL